MVEGSFEKITDLVWLITDVDSWPSFSNSLNDLGIKYKFKESEAYEDQTYIIFKNKVDESTFIANVNQEK